jgi:hypothetical protein
MDISSDLAISPIGGSQQSVFSAARGAAAEAPREMCDWSPAYSAPLAHCSARKPPYDIFDTVSAGLRCFTRSCCTRARWQRKKVRANFSLTIRMKGTLQKNIKYYLGTLRIMCVNAYHA